ncbi:MAG: alpha/beta fold hydrolase, partial [Cyclobacteriaceae bacterium]|nr:alpha/beta fold hydrolase [Cyclobacteriaceae bacterium]
MKVLKKIFKGIFYTLIFIIAAFLFLYLYTSGPWIVAETVAQDSTISHITIDDVVFHAETHGNDTARTIIVIHGGPGQDYRYLLSLKALSDEYRVVFYDQRGTGLSPRVEASELTLQSSIEDLDRIVNYYCPDEKVNILGHSWGGMLGSAYLAKYPDKVHKIILAEPGFLTSEMAEKFMERTNGFAIDLSFDNFMLIGKIVMRSLHVRGPDDQAIKDYIFSNLVTSPIENHPMSGYFCGNKYDSTQISFWRLSMIASQAIQQSGANADGKMEIDLISGVEQYQDTVLFIAGDCNRFIG